MQKDVVEIVDTSIDCITFWENGRSHPQIHFFPDIISFWRYYPFDEVDAFSCKLLKYRHLHRLTYKQLGKRIGVDGSTVVSWEARKTIPNERILEHVFVCLL